MAAPPRGAEQGEADKEPLGAGEREERNPEPSRIEKQHQRKKGRAQPAAHASSLHARLDAGAAPAPCAGSFADLPPTEALNNFPHPVPLG